MESLCTLACGLLLNVHMLWNEDQAEEFVLMCHCVCLVFYRVRAWLLAGDQPELPARPQWHQTPGPRHQHHQRCVCVFVSLCECECTQCGSVKVGENRWRCVFVYVCVCYPDPCSPKEALSVCGSFYVWFILSPFFSFFVWDESMTGCFSLFLVLLPVLFSPVC